MLKELQVQTKTYHTCPVCDGTWHDKNRADLCFSRGVPIEPERGLIFGMPQSRDRRYRNILGAVRSFRRDGHELRISGWKLHDTSWDDGKLTTHIGWTDNANNWFAISEPDPGHPLFIRMLEFLLDKEIAPTVMLHGEPFALDKYKELWNFNKVELKEK